MRSSEEIGPSHLRDRVRSHLPGTYLLIVSIVKGVAIGNAGVALGHYLTGPPSIEVVVTGAGMITVSLMAITVTYNATVSGSLLASWRPSWVDTLMPMLIGLLEFLMFTVAQSGTSSRVVAKWSGILVVWGLMAAFVIWHIRRRLPVSSDKVSQGMEHDDGVQDLYIWYRSALGGDLAGASTFSVLAGALFVVASGLGESPWWIRATLTGILLAFLAWANVVHERNRSEMYKRIHALPSAAKT
jgi:hypothetical protein